MKNEDMEDMRRNVTQGPAKYEGSVNWNTFYSRNGIHQTVLNVTTTTFFSVFSVLFKVLISCL
jgi:hypothetical protein